ncbi:hypothetical protein FHX03_000415 [Rhizobium sp. BK456]|nr:hypothetical protein [Rhizobium sp. BK456]
MSRGEIIRHNAKLILRNVRGKSAEERRLIFAVLRLGPLGLPLALVQSRGRSSGLGRR